MRGWRAFLCCAALSAASAVGAVQPAQVLGEWEYRQANSASPTGVDREGERLVLKQDAAGRLVAEYYGLERTGDHGLFYTAVAATAVAMDADGTLRLTVPPRQLFRRRPATLAEATRLEPAGATKDELTFTGRRITDTLELSCSGAANACPDSRMVFRRR